MGDRPTGTVTFMFTDVVGSTRLWEERGAAMAAALQVHDHVLRSAVADRGGVVFSTGGDGLAAVFARAGDAVEAAVAAQVGLAGAAWPDGIELRVRIGLHTGEAEERDGDYFGPAVNLAARLMSLADGGHVMSSLATAEVVRNGLRQDLGLVDAGEQMLKGMARAERVYQVVWPGAEPSRPRPTVRAAGNLPRTARPLIGRDRQVDDLCVLVAHQVMVTLTGVGGAGKTSMALAAASRLAPQFTDGVWFVDLATVLQPENLWTALSHTLSVRPQVGVTMDESVIRYLSDQHCLLVLDNCEHVLDAAADLATTVRDRCARVSVLATSREGLGVPGERLVAVRALDLGAAVELFRARASEHTGGVEPAGSDDALVSELCERLDGLPLAIELAAARARSMPLADLTARLGERFRLLRGQRRGADRHQTLRTTVAWSYDLLSEDERRLFDRLSVFTGGFDLMEAEAVCGAGGWDDVTVDELVVALVEKSMIDAGPQNRYRLLETLRQFGEERLQATDDPDRYRRAHLEYFTTFTVACHDGLQGRDALAWLRRLHADWANVRAAFGWAVATDGRDAAATIASELIWAAFWHDVTEPYAWAEQAAAMPGASAGQRWHDVLAACAWAAWENVRNDVALDLGLRALAAQPPREATIDYFAEFSVLSALAFDGHVEEAYEHAERSLDRARRGGHSINEAWNMVSLALLCNLGGRTSEALTMARAGRELAESVGNATVAAWAVAAEGASLRLLGHPGSATTLADALERAEQAQSPVVAWFSRSRLIGVLMADGHPRAAIPLLLDDLRLMRQRPTWIHRTFIAAATVLAELGRAEAAAVLSGAIDTVSLGVIRREPLEQLDEMLRAGLEPATIERLVATGARLTTGEAADFAVAALGELRQS